MNVVIAGGTALVGPRFEPLQRATLSIENGTIVGLDAHAPPVEHTWVDASGLTLLPGFIDAHVHIGFYAPEQVLAGGVTTARDLAWPPKRIHALARRSRAAEFPGPLVLAAGPMLTAPGGYPSRAHWAPSGTAREVGSVDEAAPAVDKTVAEGASVIKVALDPEVGPTLDAAALGAIVRRAHEHGLKVTAHIHGLAELQKALDAGVDELAHMLMSEEHLPETVVERMVSQAIVVVPTLAIRSGRDREIAIENLRRFRTAGGRVVYGTDLGNSGPGPGIDPLEVAAMADAGMDGLAIVGCATRDSAAWLNLPTKGVLDVGYDADIIGVLGDPTKDVRALTDVRLVCRAGIVRAVPRAG